jgi:hypothetical protein
MDTPARKEENSPGPLRWYPPQRDVEILGDAFKRARVRGDGLDGELHRLVCEAVAHARLQLVPIEQVIIAIKRVWLEYVPAHSASSDDERLISRVITLCVDEYYR